MKKWLIRATVAIILLVVLAYIGLQVYLSTPHAARLVASKLEPIVGGPVELGGLSLDITGSSVSSLKLFAEGAEEPWLTVDQINADLSLLDIIGGSTNPKSVAIEGANLIIEIDADGNLKTEFPESGDDEEPAELPRIVLRSGSLTLRQDGKPEAKFTGLDAELSSEDGAMILDGSLNDPDWGEWTIAADIQADSSSGDIRMSSDRVVADMDRLRGIPFIPNDVWDQMSVAGPSSVKVMLKFSDQPPSVKYRVELDADGVEVSVPTIDTALTGLRGNIVIDQTMVTLRGVTGSVAGGQVRADAEIDFGPDEPVLDFRVGVEKLEIGQLPKSWQFPEEISGNLNGDADLQLTLAADGPKFDGSGHGEVLDARFGTIEVDGPIVINLTPTDDGFHFGQTVSRDEHDETQREGSELSSELPFTSRPLRALRARFFPPVESAVAFVGEEPWEDNTDGLIEIELGLTEVDLLELFRQLEVEVPLQLAGKLTVQVKVGIPTEDPGEFQKFRLDGTAELATVTIEGVELREVMAEVTYRDGVLTLEDFRGSLPEGDGTYAGTAEFGVFPEGDLTAKLKLIQIPWKNLAAITGDVIDDPAGDFSGEATLHAPAGTLGDIQSWRASCSIESQSLKTSHGTLTRPRIVTKLEDGVLRVTEYSGSLEGIPFTGDAELTVAQPYPFRASLTLAESDLTALNRLPPSIRPPVTIDGKLTATTTASGTLSPLDFEAGGDIRANDLAVDGFRVGEAGLKWTVGEEQFSVTELTAKLYDGEITASATFPFAKGAAGTAAMKFAGVDLGAMTEALDGFPVPLEGKAWGAVRAKLSAEGMPAMSFAFTAPNLTIRDIPTDTLSGTGSFVAGMFSYKVEGKALGGSYDLHGTYPTGENQAGPTGSVHLHEMRLQPLWRPLGLSGDLRSLSGLVHLDFDYSTDPGTGELAGTGSARLTSVRWDNDTVTEQISSRIDVTGQSVQLRNVTSQFAGGRLNAEAAVDVSNEVRGTYSLTVDGADAQRLFNLLELDDVIDGRIKLRMAGRIDRAITGRGDVQLSRARFGDIPLTSARIPLDWSVGGGRGICRLRGGTATLAGGRVRFRADYRFGSSGGIDGHADFSDVDLGELLKPMTESSFAKGKVSGRLEFDSSKPESVNDWNGRLYGQIKQASAASLPILDEVARMVPGMQSVTGGEDGEFDVVISRGAVRIRELSLASNSLQLFVEGTSTLSGRLDLSVIASTQPIAPAPLLKMVSNVIPVGPVPLSVLLELGEMLANRTVQLDVSGTASSPMIRINPLRTISEEAVKYFLGGVKLPGVN